ncbi:nascent polypeptide-associated complex subunit alpha, muscle-specific form-like [Nannospalax galili]|uniref:nascent polypeptide-associated complex subunit alpha, muscle-specific form-like n=1 Tax=Nannospalax galili TaxID=1026970 RepID=UPI0004ED4999|nr:nascent polypeptide-associated complex subunit alpha, muscle-specific form-like [Nannospalax galili]
MTASQPASPTGQQSQAIPCGLERETAPRRWGAPWSPGQKLRGPPGPTDPAWVQRVLSDRHRLATGRWGPTSPNGAALDSQSLGLEVGGEERSRPDSSPNFSRPLGRTRRPMSPRGGAGSSRAERRALHRGGVQKKYRGCPAAGDSAPPCPPPTPEPVPVPKENRPRPLHPGTPTSPWHRGAPPTHRARASGRTGCARGEAPAVLKLGAGTAASSASPAGPPPRGPLLSEPASRAVMSGAAEPRGRDRGAPQGTPPPHSLHPAPCGKFKAESV